MRIALSCVHSMYQRGTEPKRSSVKRHRRGRDRDRLRPQPLHGAVAVLGRDVGVEQRRQLVAREGVGRAVGTDLARQAEHRVGLERRHVPAALARGRQQAAEIDQRLDLAPPRLGELADGDAAQRMADQHHRLVHLVEQARELLDIVGQRDVGGRRVVLAEARQVGRADLVAVGLQERHDLFPAPAAGAGAVDQHEGRHDARQPRPTTVRAPGAGTKKSGISGVPGDTAYWSKSVTPSAASTSSSMKKLPVQSCAGRLKIA